MTFHTLQSMPSSLPSCQRRSITGAAYSGSTRSATAPPGRDERSGSWGGGRSRPPNQSGRPGEHRLQHLVGAAHLFGLPPVADQREDPLGVLDGHAGRLVGPDVGELTQRNVEGDRHVIEAVDGDRFLAALDLADELAAEAGALTQSFLAQAVLLAQGAQPLPEELAHMLDRSLSHNLSV